MARKTTSGTRWPRLVVKGHSPASYLIRLRGQIAAYRGRQNPNARADFTIDGYIE